MTSLNYKLDPGNTVEIDVSAEIINHQSVVHHSRSRTGNRYPTYPTNGRPGNRYPTNGGAGNRYPTNGGAGKIYLINSGAGKRFSINGGPGNKYLDQTLSELKNFKIKSPIYLSNIFVGAGKYPTNGGSGNKYPTYGGSGNKYPTNAGAGNKYPRNPTNGGAGNGYPTNPNHNGGSIAYHCYHWSQQEKGKCSGLQAGAFSDCERAICKGLGHIFSADRKLWCGNYDRRGVHPRRPCSCCAIYQGTVTDTISFLTFS